MERKTEIKIQITTTEKIENNPQLKVVEKIINDLENGNIYNASILIRFWLNDNSYKWYKPIERIIENQISNLFYDCEHGTKKTLEFFKMQKEELIFDIENGYL